MTSKEREDYFEIVLFEAKKIRETKGSDYSGLEDANRNFKEGSKRLGLTPSQILGVYLDKHLDSIHTFIKDGVLKSEPIEGRVIDAINYLLILLSIYEEEKSIKEKIYEEIEENIKGIASNILS